MSVQDASKFFPLQNYFKTHPCTHYFIFITTELSGGVYTATHNLTMLGSGFPKLLALIPWNNWNLPFAHIYSPVVTNLS